ncbi:hypothetical protein CHS0354_033383 [Potamilus streckersoni]|uniref:Uncharacterized protein n=1 Tax=Potamilus streckersoni TaxID=2493646 RepID=A0AAE0VJR8_9BIVA|nr:hypothetical protein CHS0354_033383 [Potamilus streckersoni]
MSPFSGIPKRGKEYLPVARGIIATHNPHPSLERQNLHQSLLTYGDHLGFVLIQCLKLHSSSFERPLQMREVAGVTILSITISKIR